MIPTQFAPLASHVWQSTLFAAAAVLLTLALRRNHARVRYAILLAASYKFLLPFSWLVSLGRLFEWRAAPAALPHAVSTVTDVISAPAFLMPAIAANPVAEHVALLPLVVWFVWGCGSLIVAAGWVREWVRLRAMVRAATPLAMAMPIPVVCVRSRLEPGVFGIFRPLLLLPEGITEKLSPAQLRVVLAHELCHVRRRDNLAAALHMLVEALFWFHPLVWWLDRRIVEERERACDEEVVRMGGAPESYAETILAVCKSYVESPIACMSGISGSDLKKRVVNVMANRRIENLGPARKLLLSALGIATIAAPLVFGIINAPLLDAQTPDAAADWEKAAGGKQSFEVASVKENKSSFVPTAIRIVSGYGDRTPPGGLLRTVNQPIAFYIQFAYKLDYNQAVSLQAEMPKWAREIGFDIEARTQGDLPRDQARLMMQSLLADRFKLAVHFETKEGPAYALILDKAGKLGPQMRAYPDGFPCSAPQPVGGPVARSADGAAPTAPTVDDGQLPASCGYMGVLGVRDSEGNMRQAGRNLSVDALIDWISRNANLDRSLVDRTGLSGAFDVSLESSMPIPPDRDAAAASFREALGDQLGLKLQSITAPVSSLVIDHIERPSPN